MHKILNIIILTTILTLTITATSLAAWQITLDVSTPDTASDTGLASNKLYIGTDPAATDGYDSKLDTPALLRGPVQAYISHPEYQASLQKLWGDIRKDSFPQEWQIEVASSGINNPVKVTWKIDAPSTLSFTLVDKESNQEISMASSTEYSYSSTTTSPKKFLLKASDNSSIPPSTGSQSNSGGGSKGGGCGTIKNTGRDGKYPGGSGSAALNMVILFSPLIWLAIRRVVFSGGLVYIIKEKKGLYRRHYGEKYNKYSALSG